MQPKVLNKILLFLGCAVSLITAAPTLAGDVLDSNRALPAGYKLDSANGCFSLVQQNDGNFVLYNNVRRQALWHTGTYNRAVKWTVMQSDGNLVTYDPNNRPIWASNTDRRGGVKLVMQNDGNAVIYRADNQAVWATNTFGSCNVSSNNPGQVSLNPDLNLNVVYDPSITAYQRALFTKAILNWDSIITRDMVNQGRVNIYVRSGAMTVPGGHWAETSAIYANTPRSRQIKSDGYHATITLNSSKINSLSSNQFIRLATHELGHVLYLDEAQKDQSLGYSIMHSTDIPMNISEGMYKKLEWFGYSVNRNPNLQWY
jgi:hypothetical protein